MPQTPDKSRMPWMPSGVPNNFVFHADVFRYLQGRGWHYCKKDQAFLLLDKPWRVCLSKMTVTNLNRDMPSLDLPIGGSTFFLFPRSERHYDYDPQQDMDGVTFWRCGLTKTLSRMDDYTEAPILPWDGPKMIFDALTDGPAVLAGQKWATEIMEAMLR